MQRRKRRKDIPNREGKKQRHDSIKVQNKEFCVTVACRGRMFVREMVSEEARGPSQEGPHLGHAGGDGPYLVGSGESKGDDQRELFQ